MGGPMRTFIAAKFLDLFTLVYEKRVVYFHNWKGYWTPAFVDTGEGIRVQITNVTATQIEIIQRRAHTMRVHKNHLPPRRLEELEVFKPILSFCTEFMKVEA